MIFVEIVEILKILNLKLQNFFLKNKNKIFSKEMPIINPPWLATYRTEGTQLGKEFRV